MKTTSARPSRTHTVQPRHTLLDALPGLALGLATAAPLVAAAAGPSADVPLMEITVTGTREEAPLAETPATVDSIDAETLRQTRPAHPAEIMEQVPGVHISQTNGEGHMAAIRQPLTTSPVYLYLEDGIPTRSTGFFNHNALYEVNVPQAAGIEVTKGPGTALFGSDAIGGVINVLTRPAPSQAEAGIDLESGGHGWKRMLASAGNGSDSGGLRGDLNLTRSDGWRDGTGYDRQSATVRWDHFFDSGASLKTVLSSANIDQQTAGSSRLLKDDYENHPTLNYTPISFRKVEALRLSMAYEQEAGDSLLSLTPYARKNAMELLPNWALSYDPTVYETKNDSYGLLVKYRRDFAPLRTRLIVGADLDYSPGSYFEQQIDPVKDGNIYTDYSIVGTLYDYDVSFTGISPYAHAEFSPSQRLRLTVGLRYDHMRYDYEDRLSGAADPKHLRPADTTVDFDHLSPKLGATYALGDGLDGFASYRHTFRVPSEGQLFRQGQAVNTVGLEPVKVDSFELGLRGHQGKSLRYEISVYRMRKQDDILTYQHPDGSRETMNAGETLHQGIEIGLGTALNDWTRLDVAYSYAKHTYEAWTPKTGVDYSGNEIESAPRRLANTRLRLRPEALNGGQLELEWVSLGEYWMDQANTHKYAGHDVFNLRGNYVFGKGIEVYARLINLGDTRYATAAAYTPAAYGKPEKFEYAPGIPRTLYAGISARFD